MNEVEKWLKATEAYYYCANKFLDESDKIYAKECADKLKYIKWQIKTKSPFNPGYLDDYLLKPYGGKEKLLQELGYENKVK